MIAFIFVTVILNHIMITKTIVIMNYSDFDEFDSEDESIADTIDEQFIEQEKQELLTLGKSLPLIWRIELLIIWKTIRRNGFESVQKNFRRLKNERQFLRINEYVRQGGTRSQNLDSNVNYMYEKYTKARRIEKKLCMKRI